jgi:hypothetical protein
LSCRSRGGDRHGGDRDEIFGVGQLAALALLGNSNDALGGGQPGGWPFRVQRSSRAYYDVDRQPEDWHEDECDDPRKLASTGEIGAPNHFADGKIIDRRDEFDFWKWSTPELTISPRAASGARW